MKYLLLILLFASCNATKQSAKHFEKGIKKDRVYFAKATRDSFPCMELFKTDTAIYVYDSLIYIECPDYGFAVDTSTLIQSTDSVVRVEKKQNNRLVKVPVYLPIRTQIITKYFEDSAKIVIAQKEVIKANEETVKYKGKAQRRGNLITWLIVAILALIATTILLIRSKLKR